jgi:hypothetical protein
MAETVLTVQDVKGPFETIAANGADFTFAAADTSNGNEFVCTGRDLVLVYNSGGSTYTVTITSAADEKGRSGDITTYSLSTLEFAVFGVGLTNAKGWKQTDGTIVLTASNAAVKFAILRMPAGYP